MTREQKLEKLLREARKIMQANPAFRNLHKDFLQRSADLLRHD